MGCGSSVAAAPPAPAAPVPVAAAAAAPEQPAEKEVEDIRDKYVIGRVLGSGSFGQVRECYLKVKMIEKDDQEGDWSNQAMFKREIELLQQMDHPNIINYYDFYEDTHFLYVVMEKCSGGEVFQKILELRRFGEPDAARICKAMLEAVVYIHSLDIVHRDIKAENFLFQSPQVTSHIKMIDFGMATKIAPGEHLTELCGSPHYLAPELIGQKYGKEVDLWSIGVLLYLLLYGRYPYDGANPQEIMVQVLMSKINWEHDKYKPSPPVLDFLHQLLERNPKKRVSAVGALKHPWLKEGEPKAQAEAATEKLAIPTDLLRSAHRKTTATRRKLDQSVEKRREEALKKIDEDYKHEFVRRANKLRTAPSAPKPTEPQKSPAPDMNAIAEGEGEEEEEKEKDALKAPKAMAPASSQPAAPLKASSSFRHGLNPEGVVGKIQPLTASQRGPPSAQAQAEAAARQAARLAATEEEDAPSNHLEAYIGPISSDKEDFRQIFDQQMAMDSPASRAAPLPGSAPAADEPPEESRAGKPARSVEETGAEEEPAATGAPEEGSKPEEARGSPEGAPEGSAT